MINSLKRDRWFLMLFLLSVGIVMSIAWKVQKVMCNDVYILSFKQDNQFFKDLDTSVLEKEGVRISYAQSVYPEVSNGVCKKDVSVISTNENYRYFRNVQLEEGAFFNHKQIERKLKVAVINKKAAYLLYGNDNCVGEFVYLNQMPYQIIGTVNEENDNEARLYIPYQTLDSLDISNAGIDEIWCKVLNMAEMTMVISKLGYSVGEFDIVEINLYKKIFMQRLFFIFVSVFVLVLGFTKNKILQYKGKSIKEICSQLAYFTEIIFLIRVVQLSWCIPASYTLIEAGFWKVCCLLFKFYSLDNVKISGMSFLTKLNTLSIIFMFVALLTIYFCWGLKIRGIKIKNKIDADTQHKKKYKITPL